MCQIWRYNDNGGNYTKHIYMGSQRITSKVSNSGIFAVSPVKDTLQTKYATLTTKIKERFDTLGVTYNGTAQTCGLVSVSQTPPLGGWGAYFYHSDHLGSSSLITDATGALVQHIEYVPFGEVFLDERNSTWSTPYLFNGKERDEETGLYYYHARYYDSKRSVWLSVDPLAEKYPNISSYVYCANNPVKYVDPDGRKLKIANNISFDILLSTLPSGARNYINLDKNGFIKKTSVKNALSKYNDSGNLQALYVIVSDSRTAVLDVTKDKIKIFNSAEKKFDDYIFNPPTISNFLQKLINDYSGNEADKQAYIDFYLQNFPDEIEVVGNFGIALRPANEQKKFPSIIQSASNFFEIYTSSLIDKLQQAKTTAHELFGHLYFYLIGKDPRHGGESQTIDGNIELERQIDARMKEAENNFKR